MVMHIIPDSDQTSTVVDHEPEPKNYSFEERFAQLKQEGQDIYEYNWQTASVEMFRMWGGQLIIDHFTSCLFNLSKTKSRSLE